MTKKIFRSILSVAVTVLLAAIIIIMGVLYNYFESVQQSLLNSELDLISEAVEKEGLSYLNTVKTDNCRITWVSSDGTVIFDSITDPAVMENHANREEIREAMESGDGESLRYSSTLTTRTLYRANKLSDGTVLRISSSYYTIPMLLLGMLFPIILVFTVSLILSGILAKRVAKRIVKPLQELDLQKPLENNTYEELSPVLTHIEQQRKRIESQYNELKIKQDEFNAITSNLNEGLVLLNNNGVIVSINTAAAVFLNTDENCVGSEFIIIERNHEIDKAVKSAVKNGKSELIAERNGKIYQLNISRVDSDGKPHGLALLIFDVTDKMTAEQTRKEFTANVSHELKTPLQSIMGSAELIENGIAKPEDIPSFASRISDEAKRLLTLINDIIRLSQIDEKTELPTEPVDLYELALKEAESLKSIADKKGITITVSGENAEIIGVRQLCHEIIYNLCDNAVKYNNYGGRVEINIRQDDSFAVLSVSDTGVGIPPEHQQRIFERFYRVDKSHSKEIGGTGLGLSIVKHAAKYLNADISLKSETDKGSTFTVTFKKQ